MKTLILILTTTIVIGCSSIQTISTPPEPYTPSRPTTDKELIQEWQQALICIKLWQAFAKINNLQGYETNE